jgi:hypothetical protein
MAERSFVAARRRERIIALWLSCFAAACERAEPATTHPPSDGVDPIEGEEIASQATAPAVPPPLTRNHATKVTLDV